MSDNADPRPPYNDPLAHVVGEALTSLGDGEYITTFDEDETFDRVVTVITERVRAALVRIGYTGRRGPTGQYPHELQMVPSSLADLPAYVFDNGIVRGERHPVSLEEGHSQ